jgi:predicted CopG family antitoxin
MYLRVLIVLIVGLILCSFTQLIKEKKGEKTEERESLFLEKNYLRIYYLGTYRAHKVNLSYKKDSTIIINFLSAFNKKSATIKFDNKNISIFEFSAREANIYSYQYISKQIKFPIEFSVIENLFLSTISEKEQNLFLLNYYNKEDSTFVISHRIENSKIVDLNLKSKKSFSDLLSVLYSQKSSSNLVLLKFFLNNEAIEVELEMEPSRHQSNVKLDDDIDLTTIRVINSF